MTALSFLSYVQESQNPEGSASELANRSSDRQARHGAARGLGPPAGPGLRQRRRRRSRDPSTNAGCVNRVRRPGYSPTGRDLGGAAAPCPHRRRARVPGAELRAAHRHVRAAGRLQPLPGNGAARRHFDLRQQARRPARHGVHGPQRPGEHRRQRGGPPRLRFRSGLRPQPRLLPLLQRRAGPPPNCRLALHRRDPPLQRRSRLRVGGPGGRPALPQPQGWSDRLRS